MAKAISVADRIQWHEGMLLSPQHFQQTSARLDSLVAWHTLLASPFSWGVRRLKIDKGLLPAGIIRVLHLDAIMADGTAVSFDSDNATHGVLELNLAPFLQEMSEGDLNFFLVLPIERSMRDKSIPTRFRSLISTPVDDEVSDAVPADIPKLLPNLEIVAGQLPSGLYTHLRLGTVSKDNEVIKLGATLPPLIEIPRDCDLWEKVTAFVEQLRGKAAFVAKQTAVPSSKIDDRLAYLEQRERLRNLVTCLPLVEAVLRTPSLHPYALYLALCGLLGPLSLLRHGALPPLPPEYDHANPEAVLEPILIILQESLQEVSQEYREYKFEYLHGAFEILLKASWLDKQLVIGLRGQPEKDLIAWMGGAIVGSKSVYASLRERRVLGASRVPIEVAPELGLRASSGYTLFAIQASEVLTVAGEFLIISNSTESAAAQRPQEMVFFVKG